MDDNCHAWEEGDLKHVVVQTELREQDIRPANLLSRFRELSIEEAARFFGDASQRVEVACPACAHAERRGSFEKQGFRYNECSDCGSLYVSPRPTAAALAKYYAESRAIEYRAEHLIRDTAEARRRLVLRANANWMARLVEEVGPRSRVYADRGTNYPSIFEEVAQTGMFARMLSIEPLAGLAEPSGRSGAVVGDEGAEGLGALSAFEQLEHQFSPLDYLRGCRAMLGERGMLFVTTRTVSGFDLQVLWDKAPYIYVPEHLNLMSTEGLSRLLDAAGFEPHELSTPGQLDVELVRMSVEADPTIPLSRFVRQLIGHRDPMALVEFQGYLQKFRLSSHIRIAAIRREEQA